jgi:trehalose 6-phosphate phosphatase
VLELRPVGGGGKDAAVAALLAADGVTAVAYAGDDRTDLDAFRRLRYLREQGELETAICVGITSPEGPPEIAEESDLRVDGPEGWIAILESLAA